MRKLPDRDPPADRIAEYEKADAHTVLIQPVGEHEAAGLENELNAIRTLAGEDFRLLAVKVERWNRDLSPWDAPAVFHGQAFGSGAAATLELLTGLCRDRRLTYYIGGYSLAGLFALWAACQTDVFSGVAAASPSMWFPGFSDFLKEHPIRAGKVYLSLGEKEEKAHIPVLRTVGNRVREGYALLRAQGVECKLEWNAGNHFCEPELRTARAFAWLMNTQRSG